MSFDGYFSVNRQTVPAPLDRGPRNKPVKFWRMLIWLLLAERKKRVDLTPRKRVGTAIFLLWLLLVNVFYYEQFRGLIVSRLPWLGKLWP